MDHVDITKNQKLKLIIPSPETREDNVLSDEDIQELDSLVNGFSENKFINSDYELIQEHINRSKRFIQYFCHELNQSL
jgi:hypothetical protein|tara:strand:- start:142 stop:375 length:234 start_codon:yes stop_codon:yes gene_type:complete